MGKLQINGVLQVNGALNFANGTWNNLGDDVKFGDQNVAGAFVIQGINGTTNLRFIQHNNTAAGSISFDGTNFSISNYTKFLNGLESSKGLTVSGRVLGGGDDEGIIIGFADNGYAGLTLGGASGRRSVFYLNGSEVFWRYNDGTNNYNIHHPVKNGTIALTSDLSNFPTKTGSGASGTWGINITGSATSLSDSTAGSLTWMGDHFLSSTNRPTAKLHFGGEQLYFYNGSYYALIHAGNIGSQSVNYANTAGSINAQTAILAASEENNALTAINNTNTFENQNNLPIGHSSLYMKKALDFQWYTSHWRIGNLRSGGAASQGFGFAFSSDNSTWTLNTFIDPNGCLWSKSLASQNFGTADPSGSAIEGTLYFKIVS